MILLRGTTITDTYHRVMWAVHDHGEESDSRNGRVLSVPSPVAVVVERPNQRVLHDTNRNANPFFHLFESLWMLAGRRDVAFIRQFNQQMVEYSDDGEVFNGAYGYRWRKHFGYDQIAAALDMLKTNPLDRRVVVSMWDAYEDLGRSSKDIPCNQQVMFRVVGGRLNMLTTNRSNDAVWGLMGANAVHLTMLMEYMAVNLDLPVGEWSHVTNNLHIYERHWPLLTCYPTVMDTDCDYKQVPIPKGDEFMLDCELVSNGVMGGFRTDYFRDVVSPMLASWMMFKCGMEDSALLTLNDVKSEDWRIAAIQWIHTTLRKRHGNV